MTATPDTIQSPAPAQAGERIASLDFIRGIAVMGILWANIVAFGQPMSAYMHPGSFLSPHGEVSEWMWIVQFVLVDGKMRGLFTLLFGAGMYLFMEKAWARGATRWLQARRLGFLLMFGLIHFYLIWRGDILILYSIVGFVALACVRWKAKTQMAVGLTAYLVGALVYAATAAPSYWIAETAMGEQPQMVETRAAFEQARDQARADDLVEGQVMGDGGSYVGFLEHNFSAHGTDPLMMLWIFGFETLPLMLIGMALYRIGFFAPENRREQLRWGFAGIVVGVALTLPIALWASSTDFSYWATFSAFMGLSFLPRLPMILGLAAVLAVIGTTTGGWFKTRVSAAGRAGFTNYLGTSVVMMLVFHPWAGGLWGDLTRPQLYLVVLGAWAVMLSWSKPWLDRYRFGPLEWLWRCLTYGRLVPLRRKAG